MAEESDGEVVKKKKKANAPASIAMPPGKGMMRMKSVKKNDEEKEKGTPMLKGIMR